MPYDSAPSTHMHLKGAHSVEARKFLHYLQSMKKKRETFSLPQTCIFFLLSHTSLLATPSRFKKPFTQKFLSPPSCVILTHVTWLPPAMVSHAAAAAAALVS